MAKENPHEKYMKTAQMDLEAPDAEAQAAASKAEEKDIDAEKLAEDCRALICPACNVKAEAEETRLRAVAEMDNFKKRLSREHGEMLNFAAEKVMKDLLPTIDNLDLALQHGKNSEACKDMLLGVEMTRKLLLEAVAKHGLVPCGEEGEEFNPEFHEAMSHEARSDMPPGMVSRVLQKGYKLKERLIRPAKVLISQ